jgi:pimeloyl-ACP methyl ester carboxylesterase
MTDNTLTEAVVKSWRAHDWADLSRTVDVGADRIAYVDLGEGDLPVLLLHGLGGNWTAWLETLPAVARDHRVIAIDLPGFGASAPGSDGISIPGYARTVERFCKRMGLDEVIVAGSSLGGWVAAELTLRAPELVKGLVLIDAAGMVPTRAERFRAISMMRGAELGAPLAPKFRAAIASRPRLRNLALKYTVSDPSALAADLVYMALPAAPDPGFGRAFTAARRSWSDAWCDQVTEIECPTLIVWGERDTMLPLRQGREWARRIRGSEFHVIPDAGHLPMLERPVLVNGLLETFLKQVAEADC